MVNLFTIVLIFISKLIAISAATNKQVKHFLPNRALKAHSVLGLLQ